MCGCHLLGRLLQKNFHTRKILVAFICTCMSFIFSSCRNYGNLPPVKVANSDSLQKTKTIDSLKRKLADLKDSSRVDCLNKISEAYRLTSDLNSAEKFALQGHSEAQRTGYVLGLAKATTLRSEIAIFKYFDFSMSRMLAEEAIRLYRHSVNKDDLHKAHLHLGHSLYAYGLFQDAVRHFDSSHELSDRATDDYTYFYSGLIAAYATMEAGDYKNAFERALILRSLTENYKGSEADQLILIADLYRSIKDYATAISYYKRAILLKGGDNVTFQSLAELYSLNNQFDSATSYFRLVDTNASPRALDFYLAARGEFDLLQKNYKGALPNFRRHLLNSMQKNDLNQSLRALVNLARTHFQMKNWDSVQPYIYTAVAMAKPINSRVVLRDCFEILHLMHEQNNNIDSSHLYLKKFTRIQDTLRSAQIEAKLVSYNFDQQISLLNKEKQLQNARLEKESLLKKILIGAIICGLIITFFIFRTVMLNRESERKEREMAENELQIQRLQNETTKAELQQHAMELEMQALRAQMNPHFIFNSLNSINRFILQNERLRASEYLTKFSRLVRLILQNSQALFVKLETELECLELYLQLEQVRCEHKFSFEIDVADEVDPSAVDIPPLIIQPFAENAIWHGLMHRESGGKLEIQLRIDDQMLFCTIRDNGIGRVRANELKDRTAGHKSMAMRITADRIALMKKNTKNEVSINIVDLILPDGEPAGTEVIIKVPVC